MHRAALATLVCLCGSVALSAPAATQAFGMRDLIDLVQKRKLTSVEAVLHRLPKALRENFTLVRESESSQGASADNPRALLFGDDGKLLVAFNGEKNQGGYYAIEAIEATDEGPLEFREIVFPPDGGTVGKVSESNPRRCTGCHGVKSGYRWSGYSKWPGLYGDDDDRVADVSPYAKAFDRFREGAPKHPRYSALVFPEGPEERRYPYWSDLESKTDRNLDHMPNTRLSKAIVRNEARARIALSRGRDWYRKASPAWAFDALQCEENPLSNRAFLGLELSRRAALDAVPKTKDRTALDAARLAALADTSKHADYKPPSQDGVDSWEDALDSAMLVDVGNSVPDVRKVYDLVARRLAKHYDPKEVFSGKRFRAAALDDVLLVKATARDYDYDDLFFFGFSPETFAGDLGALPKAPDAPESESKVKERQRLVAPGCHALAERFEEIAKNSFR